MAKQEQVQKRAVKRIDEAVKEQETAEHEELLSKARRASKRASLVTQSARSLLCEIEGI